MKKEFPRDEEGIGARPRQTCKARINLADRAGVQHLNLQTDGTSRRFHVAQRSLGIPGIVRVDQHANAHGSWHQLVHQLEALCY